MEIETKNIKFFIILLIAFYGFLLAALTSIGQLIADRKSIKTWLFWGLFFVFGLFQIHYILSKHTILKNPPAFVIFFILILFVLTSISDLVAFVSFQKIFMEISVLLLTAIIIFLFLINFKYPDYYKLLYDVVENEKKRRSYLKGINFKELNSKLDYLMEKEEIFTNENISLASLAQKVNISQHHLSQFLNDKKGKSFSSYINKYRVKKAKKVLIENPDEKILAIAYDVGFQSKSTFNAAFIKFVNKTPHEFREKNLK